MKNVEKYSNEILDIYSSGHRVAVNKCTNEPVKCCISCITCHEYLFFINGTCDISMFIIWLDKAYISGG